MKNPGCGVGTFSVPELEIIQVDYTIKASNIVSVGYEYPVCYECTVWGSTF